MEVGLHMYSVVGEVKATVEVQLKSGKAKWRTNFSKDGICKGYISLFSLFSVFISFVCDCLYRRGG